MTALRISMLWPVCLLSAAPWGHARGAEIEGNWTHANKGAIPASAVRMGRSVDGRVQHVCRGRHASGIHVGKIAKGLSGCSVGFNGREVILPFYEVLTASSGVPSKMADKAAAVVTPVTPHAVIPAPRTVPPVTPVANAVGSPRRGFDEQGQPYVEQRTADGTIYRRQRNGILIIKPDGTRTFAPNPFALANAPMPSPPELPADPARGRNWLERHNDSLLVLIRGIVSGDESEMKKFSAAEKIEAGDDLFQQIVFRTSTATFLGSNR